MEAKVYNREGKASGKVTLPESVFGVKWNADLVHQVAVSMAANARTPVADTKGRGEVRGGGKKPWKQKGTGRARHGSSRSPIWRGGGVTHGPLAEKVYTKKINRKMRVQALFSALSEKYRQGEVLFVNEFNFTDPKTSEARAALISLATVSGFDGLVTKKKNSAVITFFNGADNDYKSLRNFSNIDLEEIKNLNLSDVLSHKYLIISNPEQSVEFMESKLQ